MANCPCNRINFRSASTSVSFLLLHLELMFHTCRKGSELPQLLDDPAVLELAKKYSKTPAQILIRFLIQLELAPIPKSTNPDRLKENINVSLKC